MRLFSRVFSVLSRSYLEISYDSSRSHASQNNVHIRYFTGPNLRRKYRIIPTNTRKLFWSENVKGRDNLEDLVADGKQILKCVIRR